MPTYEYVCEQCGDQLEVFQSFHDRPLKKHSKCGGRLSKVIHPTGVIFKGPGFYSTDSRKGASAAKGSKDSAKSTSKTKETKKAESTDSSGSDSPSSSKDSKSSSKDSKD